MTKSTLMSVPGQQHIITSWLSDVLCVYILAWQEILQCNVVPIEFDDTV